MRKKIVLLPLVALAVLASPTLATNTPQTLPFSQNWANPALITAADDWSGVPGIEGFRGDGLTVATAVDPQTVVDGDDTAPVIDVNQNITTPNTNTTGGVGEIDVADDAVALQGSGTADAPYLRLYLNTTGQTGITVAYNVRDMDGSADNAVQAVALQFRVGSSGNFTNVAAGFVADGTTANAATQVTAVCAVLPVGADNQALVQVRMITTNAAGNDEWVGIDDIVVNTAGCGPSLPTLSINDVSQIETDAGTTNFVFTVSLTGSAAVGNVTFNVATADDTATLADNDYQQILSTPTTIVSPATSTTVTVLVNGDVTAEPNQTFFVNITGVSANATAGDVQGLGTIQNDDLTLTPIHDIQGPGASSPIVSSSVTTRGIVTGVRSNGFFIQEPDATVDADPATSEGVLVFTNAAPPVSAVVGNLVQVTGTVAEFVPSADALQPPLTELTSPTVSLISSGNPLPAAIPLTTSFPSPAGPHDQLERLEAMRVSAAALTVTGPTLGNTNEPTAIETSTGVFYGVVQGNPRPFREPGIPAPDPAPTGEIPAGSIPPIPRFDSNPERIRVDSDGLVGGTILDVGFGQTVSNLVGPLDYTFRTYTILPDVGSSPAVSGGVTEIAASITAANEFTVASYNLERFFDTVDEPGISDPILTPTAFANRLGKASRQIRNFLRFPDIIGAIEVENLTTLQALATQINNDAVANSQPNPLYVASLVEGNDIGGIDVGFLVKTSIVFGSNPRVFVNSVTQELDGTLFVNADSSTETLHDRPPLRLDAVVNGPSGGPGFPITVIVNHLRSLGSVNSEAAGSNGWTTAGERVRAKRHAQAVDLANLIQTRQTNNAAENIVVMGDFNAFEVNDGLGDSMGVIQGTPVPDNQTAVAGDGVDLVNPDLDNLFDNGPAVADRYSYTFDGNAQSLDHILVNQPLITATAARRIEHPRINADFAAIDRNDYSLTGNRALSDHDPVVAFFTVTGLPVELLNFDVE